MDAFNILIFPGFLFSVIIGLFASWFERKLSARFQFRIGPPWYQSFIDILKLFKRGGPFTHSQIPLLIGILAVSFTTSMVFEGCGNLVLVICLLSLPSIFALCKNIKMALFYELLFALSLFTIGVKAGSIGLGEIGAYQEVNGFLLLSISSLLAFFIALICIQAKLSFVDVFEAESNIVGFTGYWGVGLALLKIQRALLLFVLPLTLVAFFLGPISYETPFELALLSLKYIFILIIITILKNVNPHVRDQIKYQWLHFLLFGLVGIGLSFIGF